MDTFSPEARSEIMRRVRSANTTPELLVRRLLHRAGYRFTLANKHLPGNPDIVLPRYRTVVFVHGCFWHRHRGCREATMPASNVAYWSAKLERNRVRDRQNGRRLRQLGWRVVIVWECQTRRPERLLTVLKRTLMPACYELPAKGTQIAAETQMSYRRSRRT